MTFSLDEALRFLAADETAADFFARVENEKVITGIGFVDAVASLRPGKVLEIVGLHATAKSEILIQAAVGYLVSSMDLNVPLPAPEGHVVLLDLDCKFDALRFFKVLDARLAEVIGIPAERRAIMERCLEHFILLQIHTPLQFLATLATLPLLLESLQGGCRLLLIDNLSSFFWQDSASRPAVSGPGLPATADQVHTAVVSSLRTLMSSHMRAPIILTRNATVWTAEGSEAEATHTQLVTRDFLPSCWQHLITHRLLLHRSAASHHHSSGSFTNPSTTEVWAQWQDKGGPARINNGFRFWVTDGPLYDSALG